LPDGIVSSGFPATEKVCRQIGIVFDPWEVDLNRCVLAKCADGSYAADTVAMSIARQVGKTFDVGALTFADSIINPGTLTVWTAHRFKVARESFTEMRAWAKTPALKQHIDYDEITTAAGNESIPFRNGSRIVFAARERGSIRGFTKVRRLILDEGQILSEFALSDLAPTMNQAVNPQIILMGTPPKPTDPSEVWRRLREDALDGSSEGVLYVELSAPVGSDLDDREAWATANPSYPHRTSEKAMLRLRKLLSDEDFRREALGIWDESADRLINLDRWAELAVDAEVRPGVVAVDGSLDGDVAVVGANLGDAGVPPATRGIRRACRAARRAARPLRSPPARHRSSSAATSAARSACRRTGRACSVTSRAGGSCRSAVTSRRRRACWRRRT
jgi:phage terminase large subunit-like protein